MCSPAHFSFHHALNCLANMADNSGINTSVAKPSCFNFLDGNVEKLHKFFINQIFCRFGEVRRHGHGKWSPVTLEDIVTCSMVIYCMKVCRDGHAGTARLGWFGLELVKLVF